MSNVDVQSGPASSRYETVEDLCERVKQSIENWIFQRLSQDARRERLDLLISLRIPLQTVLTEYEEYLVDYPPYSGKGDLERHKRIIYPAKDACIRANDRGDSECIECLRFYADSPEFERCSRKCEKVLAYIDEMRLTPYFVAEPIDPQRKAELDRWGRYEDRNLNALRDAVARLEELIVELQ
jgi:hypothetical protein